MLPVAIADSGAIYSHRSIEKPFKFYQREEAKKRQKVNQALYEGVKKEKKNSFKAKPIPKVVSTVSVAALESRNYTVVKRLQNVHIYAHAVTADVISA